MALSRVQATTVGTVAGNPNVTSPAFGSAVTAGNGIVVLCAGWNTGGVYGLGGCADNKGNAYVQAITRFNNNHAIAIFFCKKVVTGGSGFTVTASTPGGSAYHMVQAIEVSGVGTELAPAVSAGATGSSTAPATGNTANSDAANLLAFALHATQAAGLASITVESVSPAWTQEWENLNFVGQLAAEADYRNLTSMSGLPTSASWTDATSGTWTAAVVGFSSIDDLPPGTGRVTQDVIETLSLPVATGRVTQDAIEVLSLPSAPGRISHDVVEVLSGPPSPGRVTQVVIEVLATSVAMNMERSDLWID